MVHKLFLTLETPGHRPDNNPCQLKHQHWCRRSNSEWADFFIRIWKRLNGDLVSELVPLHISEYLKPPALWIYHDSGIFNCQQIVFLWVFEIFNLKL